jgi:hypothetical protein
VLKLVNRTYRKKENISSAMAKTIENALLDYEDGAKLAVAGKYQCRDCGGVFDTPEELDEHKRVLHIRINYYLSQGMTM